jgi:hypothetical protein
VTGCFPAEHPVGLFADRTRNWGLKPVVGFQGSFNGSVMRFLALSADAFPLSCDALCNCSPSQPRSRGGVNRHAGANFSDFSGIQTSPFFLTPTSVQNLRKVDLGVSVRF